MITAYAAHPLTVAIIIGSMLVTPLYLLATWTASGASWRTGLRLAIATAIIAAVMFTVCVFDVPSQFGLLGNLMVPVLWLLPSAALILARHRLLTQPLAQQWLIGLQIFRAIGGLFLLEMTRGHLPAIFAWPAGIGDVIVALVAATVLWRHRRGIPIGRGAVFTVAGVGIVDFALAMLFGFGSSATPLQIFAAEVPNQVLRFPTGLIPLFLVPYAIAFHTLSILVLLRFGSQAEPEPRSAPTLRVAPLA